MRTPGGPDEATPADGVELARPRRWPLVVAMVAALILTAVVGYQWGAAGARPQAVPTPAPGGSATPPTTAEIYAAVALSVVSVLAPDGSGGGSAGTGVIVSADAVILTALHVVNGSETVRVVFFDGTQVDALIVGSDPAMDIAVLQPQALPSVVVPAVLGSADRLVVGDKVIAIGDQLGLAGTTTEGIVSALGRSTRGEGGAMLSGLIQFDAAVNHGSSGGPLVNAAGETVGIVVALANPTTDGTFIGIGFAVPIAVAVTAGGQQVPQ